MVWFIFSNMELAASEYQFLLCIAQNILPKEFERIAAVCFLLLLRFFLKQSEELTQYILCTFIWME